jgi:hypothetical protein
MVESPGKIKKGAIAAPEKTPKTHIQILTPKGLYSIICSPPPVARFIFSYVYYD